MTCKATRLSLHSLVLVLASDTLVPPSPSTAPTTQVHIHPRSIILSMPVSVLLPSVPVAPSSSTSSILLHRANLFTCVHVRTSVVRRFFHDFPKRFVGRFPTHGEIDPLFGRGGRISPALDRRGVVLPGLGRLRGWRRPFHVADVFEAVQHEQRSAKSIHWTTPARILRPQSHVPDAPARRGRRRWTGGWRKGTKPRHEVDVQARWRAGCASAS